jgi:DNA-directed RNA polymerase specialized sigma24 family protein
MAAPRTKRPAFDPGLFARDLAATGAQSEAAGRSLIEHCRPLLRGRFFKEGVAAQDIDDLVADVLTAIVAHVDQLRDTSRFDAWAYKIATNVLNQHWTTKGRERSLFLANADPPDADGGLFGDGESLLEQLADTGASDPGTEHCLKRQLQAFRAAHPHRHACIELLALGYGVQEIALQLDRTCGATRQFMSQCCAVVMQFLTPCLDAAQLLGRSRGRAAAE